MNNINLRLPLELIAHIATLLDPYSFGSICVFSLVCRLWRTAVLLYPSCWARIVTARDDDVVARRLDLCIQRSGAHPLDLQLVGPIAAKWLTGVESTHQGNYYSRITFLNLSTWTKQLGEDLQRLRPNFSSLRSLAVSNQFSSGRIPISSIIPLLTCSNDEKSPLQTLALTNVEFEQHATLTLPSLLTLELQTCTFISGTSCLNVVARYAPTLVNLRLRGTLETLLASWSFDAQSLSEGEGTIQFPRLQTLMLQGNVFGQRGKKIDRAHFPRLSTLVCDDAILNTLNIDFGRSLNHLVINCTSTSRSLLRYDQFLAKLSSLKTFSIQMSQSTKGFNSLLWTMIQQPELGKNLEEFVINGSMSAMSKTLVETLNRTRAGPVYQRNKDFVQQSSDAYGSLSDHRKVQSLLQH
ncbi:hypothetical protein FRC19_000868 [Serendipita sp. 401]|nr:hypothetical protein FRC19_000868 [Serendipita sp. 401]KAG9040901.1 hypothetical protein FS842_002800 [Serendipita sp. 407]